MLRRLNNRPVCQFTLKHRPVCKRAPFFSAATRVTASNYWFGRFSCDALTKLGHRTWFTRWHLRLADSAGKTHSPEKRVGAVVVDLALGVPPVQALPGRLLHHLGFYRWAQHRTARLAGTTVDLLVEGRCCSGGVDHGHAAFLGLGFSHGFGEPAAVWARSGASPYPRALPPRTVIRVGPTQVAVRTLRWSEIISVNETGQVRITWKSRPGDSWSGDLSNQRLFRYRLLVGTHFPTRQQKQSRAGVTTRLTKPQFGHLPDRNNRAM